MSKQSRALSACVLISLFIILVPDRTYPFDMDALYKDYLIQRMMIARIRGFRGDGTAQSLFNDLSQEAKRMGIGVSSWGISRDNVYVPQHEKKRVNIRKEDTIKYEVFIQKAADLYDMPPELIRAVIHVESAFVNDAVSRKGAQGLMQLMPETARDLRVFNPFDPKANIFGGTRLLRSHLMEFGSLKKALIAYNAGPEWVRRRKGVPRETKRYIRKVIRSYNEYKDLR